VFLSKTDISEKPGTGNEEQTNPGWMVAVKAAQDKKATDFKILDLRGITSFTDHFVICTGANTRQTQAISDEIGLQLKKQLGELPHSVEGYEQGDWILSDFGDFLVHVFTPKSREYYALERLWREGKEIPVPAE
jgi:ribosome-associated protein